MGTNVELGVSKKDWEDWAAQNGIAHEVLAFLRFKPALLHDFNPKAEGYSFASPRTWEFASNYIHAKVDRDVQLPIFSGCLGHDVAVEFTSFLRVYLDLPDPQEIRMNPDGAPLPKEPASQYALCGALANLTTGQSMKAFTTYMKRMSVEMQVVWLRDALRMNREIVKTPEFSDWITAHGDLLK
jgi:hypothetical protein